MTVFADSSVVVKRYADEPGAAEVRRHALLVVSALARVEVAAALWRKQRDGDVSPAEADVLEAEFVADWDDRDSPFVVVAVEPVLSGAAAVARRQSLRAYAAVQLATALAVRDSGVGVTAFLTADRRLAEAAAREGLPVR